MHSSFAQAFVAQWIARRSTYLHVLLLLMQTTRFAGSKITFCYLLYYLISVADLCRSKTPLFIYVYIKIHYFDLMKVREGPQGKNLSLCTYLRYICYKKLKFLSSYTWGISKELFNVYLCIKIKVLDYFRSKKCQNWVIINFPSLDHGAV